MSGNVPQRERSNTLSRLSSELKRLFREWAEAPTPWLRGRFERLAIRAFEVQFERNGPYRRYCEARGIHPAGVKGWREIPAVPSAAFRAVPLVSGRVKDADLVFCTSGTTRGPDHRGTHYVLDPELYRCSLRAGFRHFVLDRLEKAPGVVTLQEPFTVRPDSSLSWMLDDVRGAFGGGGSECVASEAGIDWSRLRVAVERAADAGRSLCLLGTTVAFGAWLDVMARESFFRELAPGSGIMDTGGSKGRDGFERGRVVAGLVEHLGIAPRCIVNEFGMTELLSQRYDEGASARGGASGGRLLFGPPWLRTRVLDPVTLEELPEGEVGVLCHFDLANAGSVCHVLTEDMGRMVDERVEWLGRAPGAPPRGCSLATAELLAAQEGMG